MTHFLKTYQLKVTNVYYVKNKSGILEQLLWVVWPRALMRCGEVEDCGSHLKAEWTKGFIFKMAHSYSCWPEASVPACVNASVHLLVFRTTLCGIKRGRKTEARMSFMGCGKDQGREYLCITEHSAWHIVNPQLTATVTILEIIVTMD